jgi:hypothetical protein
VRPSLLGPAGIEIVRPPGPPSRRPSARPEGLRLPDGKATRLAKPTRVSAGCEIVPTLVDLTTEYGVGVPKFSFLLDVRDPPANVIGAMVDFSERRPEIWPNLTARLYQVHELGPRTADVTEGTALPVDIWERVTYEWTDSVVRGVITDGRIFEPGGTFEFRVEPYGAGSRISNDYHRRSKRPTT